MTLDISKRVFNARPDTVDFRDRIYQPAYVGFSTDSATHLATIGRILGRAAVKAPMTRSAIQAHEAQVS